MLSWRESGGPQVTAPTRRGLGSTIIEQTIPHEVGGEAAIAFDPAGLSARFVLPAVNVAEIGDSEAAQPKALAVPRDERGDVKLTGEALVVEDNMIIAMEAEDILTELGATRCHVAGSVDRALSVLTRHPVEFALLDINLGPETSEAVAEELLRRRIPFIFASGYGDGMASNERLAAVPVATKPFTPNDIRAAIRNLG